MATKRHKPEDIVTVKGDRGPSGATRAHETRQVKVLVAQDMARVDVIREVRITKQTYYRWRKQYGGMVTEQLREMKRLQKENERLSKAASDLTLDKLILAEAARGNY